MYQKILNYQILDRFEYYFELVIITQLSPVEFLLINLDVLLCILQKNHKLASNIVSGVKIDELDRQKIPNKIIRAEL